MAEGKWGMTASLLALIRNVNRAEGAEAMMPDDFNPFVQKRSNKLGPKESISKLIAFVGAKEEKADVLDERSSTSG